MFKSFKALEDLITVRSGSFSEISLGEYAGGTQLATELILHIPEEGKILFK
jgi:hypothetical protein